MNTRINIIEIYNLSASRSLINPLFKSFLVQIHIIWINKSNLLYIQSTKIEFEPFYIFLGS